MREGRIDYRMRRRATLREVEDGHVSVADVCDAHPELVRAGTHIGTDVGEACPICDEHELRQVTYVFTVKDRKTGHGGRAVPKEKLRLTVKRYGDVNVFAVEVCLSCHWHHLMESYWLRPQSQVVV